MQQTDSKKTIIIIGAGISGLSAAAYAAKSGNNVHVYEKHAQPGGRARQFKTENGYVFDMGPSWYWMPDIIDDLKRNFLTLNTILCFLKMTLMNISIVFTKIKNGLKSRCSTYKHLSNLFYTGQLTVPGPGVPPSIISGKIVAKEVNSLKYDRNEKVI